MRPVPVRRPAAVAACAAFLVVVSGPVATASETGWDRAHAAARESVSDAEVRLARVTAPNETGDDLAAVVELLEAVSAGGGGLAQAGDGGSLGDLIDAVLAGLMSQASGVGVSPPPAAPPVAPPEAVTLPAPTVTTGTEAVTLPAPVTPFVPFGVAPGAGDVEAVLSAGGVSSALGQTVASLLQEGVSGGEDPAEQTDEGVLGDVAALLAAELRDGAQGVALGPVMRTGQMG
ncbi:hypothetical protein [Streptomyces sp. DH20]|uniref:hypothetical protein n=1 Tax=Streptomyces sp. DH20 TaxID=2857009 RepID=UPI001E35E0E6|nr:hypothetical protein [Streptomyces sp. DH20]